MMMNFSTHVSVFKAIDAVMPIHTELPASVLRHIGLDDDVVNECRGQGPVRVLVAPKVTRSCKQKRHRRPRVKTFFCSGPISFDILYNYVTYRIMKARSDIQQ